MKANFNELCGHCTLIENGTPHEAKRWCYLSNRVIYIYKSTRDIQNNDSILTISLTTSGATIENEDNIKIFASSGDDYILKFFTKFDALTWFDAIQTSIKFVGRNEMEGFESDPIKQQIKNVILGIGNNICFECDTFGVEWANVVLGVTLCSECVGKHRALMQPFNLVKSLWMDTWEPQWVKSLEFIGNKEAMAHWQQNIIRYKDTSESKDKMSWIFKMHPTKDTGVSEFINIEVRIFSKQ